jgi:hypothetical protein
MIFNVFIYSISAVYCFLCASLSLENVTLIRPIFDATECLVVVPFEVIDVTNTGLHVRNEISLTHQLPMYLCHLLASHP